MVKKIEPKSACIKQTFLHTYEYIFFSKIPKLFTFTIAYPLHIYITNNKNFFDGNSNNHFLQGIFFTEEFKI